MKSTGATAAFKIPKHPTIRRVLRLLLGLPEFVLSGQAFGTGAVTGFECCLAAGEEDPVLNVVPSGDEAKR